VPRAGWRDPEVRRILRMGIPSCGYTSLYWLVFLGLLVVSGSVAGGVAALQLGYNFFQLPIALGATPVASAQLPRLARSFNGKRPGEFHHTYRSSLALVWFVALPAGLLFLAMPETLARAVAFGEMATTTGVALIAACIGSLALGVVGEASIVVSTSASFARRDAWAPCRAMAIRLAIAFVGMAIAMRVEDSALVLWTLGLALSAANLSAAAYLHRSQVAALPVIRPSLAPQLLGDLCAAAVSILPGILVASSLAGAAGNPYQSIGVAIAAIAASGAAYLAIQWLRGSEPLRALLAGLLGGSSERLSGSIRQC
jgi:putative peptidoglycan lipid II flippase